jgi:hypothetical protein
MSSEPVAAPSVTPTPMAGAWSVGRSVRRTLLVVLLGAVFAALNTAMAYVTLGVTKAVPIGFGLVLCFAFLVAVRLLHRAAWLSFLSLVPALFVLVGSVQLAPEAALDRRGVRHEVVIVSEKANHNRHEYALSGVDEPLVYSGSRSSYRVGDHLTVITDPDGVVELADAATVDPAGQVTSLILGVMGWTVIAVLAGWRGHVRRRRGRYDDMVI